MENYELFIVARKISNLILAADSPLRPLLQANQCGLVDRRMDHPNGYYNQTVSGLFLECYYDVPNTVWTPWGKWHFGNGGWGNWDPILPELAKHIGFKDYRKGEWTGTREIGPVFAITNFENQNLPPAIEKYKDFPFLPYEDCERIWKEMTARYQCPTAENKL